MTRLAANAMACAIAVLCCLPAASQAQTAKTRYPIVMVHGLYGSDGSALTGDYFYGIISDLRSNGATVLVAEVPAVNTNEVRGESLLRQMKQWQAAYGYAKFNLIGHSQGGPTARYISGVAPSMVASVTTMAGVNHGTPAADAGILMGAGFWGDPLSSLIALMVGNASRVSTAGALNSLSTAGAAAYNNKFPAGKPTSSCGSGPATVNGVAYYSASGTGVATNPYDISDASMVSSSYYFYGAASDGLVGRCSSHWGTVLKDNYFWNHLDEVNHIAGLRSVLSEDPVAFYRTHANRLKNAGL